MNKTEWIYNKLLHGILQGDLYQGQRLVEKYLIDSYHIGKTPLREALISLERVGLVHKNVNRGFLVKRILRQDAVEICDLREVMEGLAARKTAEHITSEKIKKIKATIDKMSKYMESGQIDEYTEYDEYFYILLGELSKNKRLVEIRKNLNYQIKMLLKTSVKLPKCSMRESYHDHLQVFKAILNKDPDKAEEMARNHIKKTKQALIEYFDGIKIQ